MPELSPQEQADALVHLLEDLCHVGVIPPFKTHAEAMDQAAFLAAHCDVTFFVKTNWVDEPMNALMACCKYGISDELFHRMLERSDPRAPNANGFTALMMAACAEPELWLGFDSLGSLFSKSDQNAEDWHGRKAIHYAARQPYDKVLKDFVRLGYSDLYYPDRNNAMLLIHAAQGALKHGSTECLDFLIERVDPRWGDRFGESAASYCRQSSEPKVAGYADKLESRGAVFAEREALLAESQTKSCDDGSGEEVREDRRL